MSHQIHATNNNNNNNGADAINATEVTEKTSQNILLEQANRCIETGRIVIEGASRPVKEAVGAAKQRIGERTEAGRGAVTSAAARAQQYAAEQRQRIGEVIDAAGGSSYAARARAAAAQCVGVGRRALEGARSSAGACQRAASELAHGTLRRIDGTRTNIRQRAAQFVDAGRERVSSATTTANQVVEEAKVRAAAISSNAKKAFSTRDTQIIMTIMGQIAAVVFLIANAVAALLCSYGPVCSAIKYVRGVAVVQEAEGAVKRGEVQKYIEKIPIIGPKLLHLIQSLITETKKNL